MGYGAKSIGSQISYVEESTEKVKMKIKKPGFFKRWLLKQLTSAQEYETANLSIGISKGSPSIDQPDRAIQFTVYNASGGRVVETRRYDRHKDRSHQGLYVITSDQDFGNEIDKIITMEALK